MSLTYGFTLGASTTSADFSNAFHALTGDGVTPWGGRLAATVSGFTVTVATGYALVQGRWVKNDEPLAISLKPASDHRDRTDALVVRVDKVGRHAAIEIAEDVDVDKLPGSLRGGDEYCIVLYLFQVRRGTTTLTPEDVTDLRGNAEMCGAVDPLSSISGGALKVYQFVTSGIDAEVNRLLAQSQALSEKADASIVSLNAAIKKVGGVAVGELRTARRLPGVDWLLCDGGTVPAEYPALSVLLGGALPNLSSAGDRYCTYIYGGTPGISKAALRRRKGEDYARQ